MPAQWFSFLLVTIVLTVVPGPDTTLGLRNATRGGASAMWWTGLGCCSGLLVHAAASVVGLSALFAASATAYTVVKFAGAAYLLWLGINALWHARSTGQHQTNGTPSPRHTGISRAAAYRQGLVSNLLNPKIVLLFLTLLPQFISPGEPRVATSLILTLLFLAVAVVWWSTTSLLVGWLRSMMQRPRVRSWLERITGGVMIALGLRVAVEGS